MGIFTDRYGFRPWVIVSAMALGIAVLVGTVLYAKGIG